MMMFALALKDTDAASAYLEIESVGEVHIIGCVNPTMEFQT